MPVPHNPREPLVSEIRRAQTLLNSAAVKAVASGRYTIRMEIDARLSAPQVRVEALVK